MIFFKLFLVHSQENFDLFLGAQNALWERKRILTLKMKMHTQISVLGQWRCTDIKMCSQASFLKSELELKSIENKAIKSNGFYGYENKRKSGANKS